MMKTPSRVTVNLGDGAQTLVVSDTTDIIAFENSPPVPAKAGKIEQTAFMPIRDAFDGGLHAPTQTAWATAKEAGGRPGDGKDHAMAKGDMTREAGDAPFDALAIWEDRKAGTLSPEMIRLFETALGGKDPAFSLGEVQERAKGGWIVEIEVHGAWATDTLQFHGAAAEALLDLMPVPPVSDAAPDTGSDPETPPELGPEPDPELGREPEPEPAPLPDTFGTLISGAGGKDFSGFSVASAGDFNGDGFDDIMIGAPSITATDPWSFAGSPGQVFVLYGGAEGLGQAVDLGALDSGAGLVLRGNVVNDQTGFAVRSAGDVNGDGIDDILIGARDADASTFMTGKTFVVFGSDGRDAPTLDLADLDGTNGFALNGIDAQDHSGWSVSTAGDINADGIDDILIGARFADPNGQSSGETYVVYGSDAGFDAEMDLSTLDGTNGFTLNGATAYEWSGTSVSNAGDVNGDGIDDILIGARKADWETDREGTTYVVFGNEEGFDAQVELSDLDGTNGFRLKGWDFLEESGFSVASAGDVNGDGIADILIGGPGRDQASPDAGQAYVVYGTDQGFDPLVELSELDGRDGFRMDGGFAYDGAGWDVESAGDVNGDGFDDILVSSPWATPDDGETWGPGDGVWNSPHNQAGKSYLVFGGDDRTEAAFNLEDLDGDTGLIFHGIDAGDRSGWSLGSAGDVNGDGFDDILIGAYKGDGAGSDAGETYLVYGGDEVLERFDAADGTADGHVDLGLLGLSPMDAML